MSQPAPSLDEPGNVTGVLTGNEWVIDAHDCDPERLRDVAILRAICDRVVNDLGVRVIGEPQVHVFPGPGGVTALYLLSESHLACHTYPEYGLATFNLYCCRHREQWRWQSELGESLAAGQVDIKQIPRGRRSKP